MKKSMMFTFVIFICCGLLFAVTGNQNSMNTGLTPAGFMIDSAGHRSIPSPTAFPANPIRIVTPGENAHLPAVSSTYVCGSAPVGGKLLINGKQVPIHPGGGFLTMLPLSPGKFEIKAELQWKDAVFQYIRTIIVAEPQKPAPVSPLMIEFVGPEHDHKLLPGDLVEVFCKGSPGMKAYFTVKGNRKKYPMTETESELGGLYRGVYRVGSKERLKNATIKVTLMDHKNRKITRIAKGTLSLFPEDIPLMAEVKSSNAVLRAGPALTAGDKAGYLMFPPAGTLLQITAQKGNEFKVRLTKTKTVWINSNEVKLLPKGTAPANTVAGSISIKAKERLTLIRLPLKRKIPFKIDPDAEGRHIDITFYGAFSNTDWINHAGAGIIKSIRWFQDDEETYRLRAYTEPNSWWGYEPRYEGNVFVFEFRTPPGLTADNSPLNGLTITVDAGHSPDSGAIGPTGYMEKDANLAQALNLREKLLEKGAKVIMTRQGDEAVSLSERPVIARKNKADLLISLHNNSLPYDGNPFVKHGYGVYYYTPMSLPLAKEIHKAYRETFRPGGEFHIPDDGLYYGNLALTRATQMPSVLIESAYMIVPEEEAYLKTDSFRSACSKAIIMGLERYLKKMRK